MKPAKEFFQLNQLNTNIQEVHDVLRSIDIKTNEGERFLLINDNSKNFILFSYESNLRNLSSTSQIYVDGTFRCCTKYFCQLFTIHVLNNGTAFGKKGISHFFVILTLCINFVGNFTPDLMVALKTVHLF